MPSVLDILGQVLGTSAVGQILDRFFPDQSKKQEFLQALQQQQIEADLKMATAQADINKVEAASGDKFVSRWRPFVGWCCGGALAYNYIMQPFLVFVAQVAGSTITAPSIDIAIMSPILSALLGFGAYRTFEKVKGAA